MLTSILDSVKKSIGIDPAYEAFDEEVMMQINTVFSELHQIGAGPTEGFSIQDSSAVWSDYLEGPNQNLIKTYMSHKVKLLFDPPTISAVLSAHERIIEQLEWRINAECDIIKPEEEVLPDGEPNSTI